MKYASRVREILRKAADRSINRVAGGPRQMLDGREFDCTIDEPVIGSGIIEYSDSWESLAHAESSSTHGECASGRLDRLLWALLVLAARSVSWLWPHASRNLINYLHNTGEPLSQNIDQLLADVPEFRTAVDKRLTQVGAMAVKQYADLGVKNSALFGFSSSWRTFTCGEYKHLGWFFALGDWEYRLIGWISVHPLANDGGLFHTVTARVCLRDRYDWDCGAVTQIGRLSVRHGLVARLHRRGIAREFTMIGETMVVRYQSTDRTIQSRQS